MLTIAENCMVVPENPPQTFQQALKIVAIGEIGLDYYWEEPDKEIQKKWFRKILSDFAGYYECGIYGSTRTA